MPQQSALPLAPLRPRAPQACPGWSQRSAGNTKQSLKKDPSVICNVCWSLIDLVQDRLCGNPKQRQIDYVLTPRLWPDSVLPQWTVRWPGLQPQQPEVIDHKHREIACAGSIGGKFGGIFGSIRGQLGVCCGISCSYARPAFVIARQPKTVVWPAVMTSARITNDLSDPEVTSITSV